MKRHLKHLLGIPEPESDLTRPLIVGTNLETGAPHPVPQSLFSTGGIAVGAPGSGKTYSLISLLQQGILATPYKPRSFVYLDLKADIGSNEVPHALRVAAEKVGIPYKAVVIGDTHFNRPTSAFSPPTMRFWQNADIESRANFLCMACGLLYGADYGPQYYGGKNSVLAAYILKRYPNACTFRQIYNAIDGLINLPQKQRPRDIPREYLDSTAFHSALSHLSRYDVLNVAPDSGHPLDVADMRVDFADLQQTPQVVYIGISKAIGGQAAVESGRVPLIALLYTSQLCPRRIPITLAADEFQVIASETLKDALNQLRGMGVGQILSYQAKDNLQTSAVDLRPNVKNLPVELVFTITDEEEQVKFSHASGQVSTLRKSYSGVPTFGGMYAVEKMNISEELLPYYSLNTVKSVSANPELSFVTIKVDSPDSPYGGLPVIVKRINRPDLADYAKKPWPQDVAGTFVPATVTPEIDPDELDFSGPVPPIHPRK